MRIRRRDFGRLGLGTGLAAWLAGRSAERAAAQIPPIPPGIPVPPGVPGAPLPPAPPPPPGAAAPAAQPSSATELTQVAEDAYVFRSMGHQALFIVTDDGVIATDPIGQVNQTSPDLYREAIASVTDKPVRYVVYSHDHQDHNEGGAALAGEAEFVAHRLAADKIGARADSQAGRSPVPTILLDDAQTLDLGGKQVQLLYLGRNHSDNSVVLLYPDRKLLYGVDFLRVNSLPSPAALRLAAPPGEWDAFMGEWIVSLARAEALDFDMLVPGHPPTSGTKADVTLLREYFIDSKEAFTVAAGTGASAEVIAVAMTAALTPKYGQVGGFQMSVPAMAQAWARAATSGM